MYKHKTLALISSIILTFVMSGVFANIKQDTSDSVLTMEVKTVLFEKKMVNQATFNPAYVHVTTNHGVVLLTGTVKSEAEKNRAEELANSVDGVKAVTNELKVE